MSQTILQQATAQPGNGSKSNPSTPPTASHGCQRNLRTVYLLPPDSEIVPVRLPDGTRTETFRDALQEKIDKGRVRFLRENTHGTVYEAVQPDEKVWTISQLLGICDDLIVEYGGIFHTVKRSAIRFLESGHVESAQKLLQENPVIKTRIGA